MSDAELVDRLVLAMVGEAARCLEEQVVESEQVLDLASVFGTGFAPFRGGLWSHARKTGYDRIAARMRELQQAPDIAERGAGAQRFEPTGLLS